MSRLHDALERLKQEEAKGAEGGKETPAAAGRTHRRSRFLLPLFLSIACVMMLAAAGYLLLGRGFWPWAERLRVNVATDSAARRPVAAADGVSRKGGRRQVSSVEETRSPVALNNEAVELMGRGRYWDALVLLRRCLEDAPQQQECYYNTMVSLYHLRLLGAVDHYYREAVRRFGETPWIRRNSQVLAASGIDVKRRD